MNPEIDRCPTGYGPRRTSLAVAVAVCGTLLVTACASPPEPTAQLQAAQQAIANAERAQAAEHAAGELNQARTKLNSANSAVRSEDMDEAARLAEQARVDAELASAKTAAVKAQAVNDEMKRSTQTLIEEMGRDADQGTTGAPGTTVTPGMGTTGTTGMGTGTSGAGTTGPTAPAGSSTTGTIGGTQ